MSIAHGQPTKMLVLSNKSTKTKTHYNTKKDMARKEKGTSLRAWKRRARAEPGLNQAREGESESGLKRKKATSDHEEAERG